MCGICGQIGSGNTEMAVSSMLPHLNHRGPDSKGVWSSKNITLGHTRLSIVDLSEAGNQPMRHPDHQLTSVVNGEIYNHLDLKKELEKEGACYHSNSDSETVLHAYWHWGTDAFKMFNGMFACGLYDQRDDSFLLVRDRIGIKPVYYHFENGIFTFASEIKAILAALGRSTWKIDMTGLSQYLTYQNMFGSQTLFKDIKVLEPGHFLKVKNGKVSDHVYWDLGKGSKDTITDFNEGISLFTDVLKDSVNRHIISDVPISSYLSAGFDSTMVAAQATHLMPEPPVCYTGYFSLGGWYDETSIATQVAAYNGAKHEKVSIGSEDFKNAFDSVIYALDEPRMGMGALPQYLVAQKAASDHKVILTGHGGDELFSGYPIFKLAEGLGRFTHSPQEFIKFIKAIRLSELPHMAYFLLSKIKSGASSYPLPVLFSAKTQSKILQPDIWDILKDICPWEQLEQTKQDSQSWGEQIYQTYFQHYLQSLLIVEDKISMAHSLETRTPLLDNQMIDLSLKIPQNIKLKNYDLKKIIKEGAHPLLPDILYKQPKRGFPTPLRFWLRGDLKSWSQNRLLGSDSRLSVLFDQTELTKFVEQYYTSYYQYIRPLDEIQTHRMWQLLSLESWLRQIETKLNIKLII